MPWICVWGVSQRLAGDFVLVFASKVLNSAKFQKFFFSYLCLKMWKSQTADRFFKKKRSGCGKMRLFFPLYKKNGLKTLHGRGFCGKETKIFFIFLFFIKKM